MYSKSVQAVWCLMSHTFSEFGYVHCVEKRPATAEVSRGDFWQLKKCVCVFPPICSGRRSTPCGLCGHTSRVFTGRSQKLCVLLSPFSGTCAPDNCPKHHDLAIALRCNSSLSTLFLPQPTLSFVACNLEFFFRASGSFVTAALECFPRPFSLSPSLTTTSTSCRWPASTRTSRRSRTTLRCCGPRSTRLTRLAGDRG